MKKWWVIGSILFGLTSCDDTSYSGNPVPFAPVAYEVNITSEYPNLNKDNGFGEKQRLIVTKKRFEYDYIGYAGLLIWVGMDNAYHAADLCCPYCLDSNVPVNIDGLWAKCPTCEEEYDISYGYCSPHYGISKYPLKQYTVQELASPAGKKLRISN